MGDMLTQAEINALLGGPAEETAEAGASDENSATATLTDEQKDILGEIGNISMGTAATTLFALLRNKVLITTPKVFMMKWRELRDYYDRPSVGIRVNYTVGLRGANVLVLKEHDVKIISNLMMGGDGNVGEGDELTELDLSAIGEAMNQMVGSASTSLSSLFNEKIDIATPQAFRLDFKDDTFFDEVGFAPDDDVALVAFRMEIGTLIDSEIMQLLPVEFALSMVDALKGVTASGPEQTAAQNQSAAASGAGMAGQGVTPVGGDGAAAQSGAAPANAAKPQPEQPRREVTPPNAPSGYGEPSYGYTPSPRPAGAPVDVTPARFQSFEAGAAFQQKENIEIIMDVPLEVTVELGRTRKKIRDILEFSPGTIVELDKLAGEPIDVLVNGKTVARGEVVVIDENFGIRITDIISVEKQLV